MAARAYFHAAAGIGSNAAPVLPLKALPIEKRSADARPLSLREIGKSIGIAMPRLISRFIELAVIGATLCARRLEVPLARNTPVYLASGLGDVARTDTLYFQVMPPNSEAASPAKFATSGNNLAAFFVAQQLGLVSRNFTISQLDLSLENALTMALDDLAAGVAKTALVGGVDETTAPRRFYRRRYPLSANRRIGEGSAWLVLGTEPRGAIGELIGVSIFATQAENDPREWADHVARAMQLLIDPKDAATLLPGGRISQAQADALLARWPTLRWHDYRDFSGCLPTAAALAIVSTFVEKPLVANTYLHVNCDAAGRTGIIAWRAY
jgi:Beta-ketoacyl synthase, N-terminal domain